MRPDADGAAAARVPAKDKELGSQEETVFFSSGEHVVTEFLTRLYEPSPSSLSEKPAEDFDGKREGRAFCTRSGPA
jgi:hypothetical protein